MPHMYMIVYVNKTHNNTHVICKENNDLATHFSVGSLLRFAPALLQGFL